MGLPILPFGSMIWSKDEIVGAISMISTGRLLFPCGIPQPIKINGICENNYCLTICFDRRFYSIIRSMVLIPRR